MSTGIRRLAVAISVNAALLVPLTAMAFADVRGSAQDNNSTPPITIVQLPTSATLAITNGPASIFGYANTLEGVLRASAVATYVPGMAYASDVSATILESVTFLSGFGTTAYLDYSFDGFISLAGHSEPQATSGQMFVFASGFGEYTTLAPPSDGISFPCGAGCVRGTSIDKTGSLAFTIGAAPMNLGASLEASAQYGNTANFSNTGRIFLRVDPGVTFTSTTGGFLSQAAPIFGPVTPVPEPETYALLMAGLGLVAAASRRKKLGAAHIGTRMVR